MRSLSKASLVVKEMGVSTASRGRSTREMEKPDRLSEEKNVPEMALRKT